MVALNPIILNLTWEALKDWTEPGVYERGRSYRSNVSEPSLTEEGGLVGWVRGHEEYATRVWVDPSGELQSECTCPYAGQCKHAVALILVALERLKKGQPLPLAKEDDPRLELLEDEADGEEDLDEEDEGEDEADEEDWDEDDEEEEEPKPKRRGGGKPAPKPTQTPKESAEERTLREHFEAMSREELLEFALQQAQTDPDLRRAILEREALRHGKAGQMVKALRREIENLAREPGWSRHWSDESNIPDYSHVRDQLAALVELGHTGEVLEVGRHLWELGVRQVEESDDDGETAGEIGRCMEVVWRALCASSLGDPEKILLAMDYEDEDEFSILGEEWGNFTGLHATPEAWSQVADLLAKRLEESGEEKYERHSLVFRLMGALERAERQSEVLPLLAREAPHIDCYDTLVDRLIEAKRPVEARRWAMQGFRKTIAESPGTAWQLEERLRTLTEKEEDWPAVAAWRAMEFFSQPNLPAWQALEEASNRLGAWDAVRAAALAYLEQGKLPEAPETETPRPSGKRKAKTEAPWPLPVIDLPWQHEATQRREYPMGEQLLDVALYEGRHDDAIAWLERLSKGRNVWGLDQIELKVATAVAESHPDVALQIWRRHTEAAINQVNNFGYETAAGYLRQMRPVYERTGRPGEWFATIQDIRKRHKPKRNLMKILTELEQDNESRRIIDTQ